jgi:hypothetical protein
MIQELTCLTHAQKVVVQALHIGEDEQNLDSGAVQRSVYIIIS